MSNATLVLADGSVYQGTHLGCAGTTTGEVVFNTGMTGYQEILTDPSYAGQLVTMTYPLIGNYGVTADDFESRQVQPAGFVIKRSCERPSNWRSSGSIAEFLTERGVVAIEGIDTRSVTRRIRSAGVMMGAISSEMPPDALLAQLRASAAYDSVDYVQAVTTAEPYVWDAKREGAEARYRVSLLDCGVKYNILRSLARRGCDVTVWPASTSAETILAANPDGVFLSPGPGDPALLGELVRTVKTLAVAKPTMGICLGNQLLGYAFGGKTYKLPFGHRGSNHPVKNLKSGTVVITSQNHGYALGDTFDTPDIEVSQVNLNDGTVEGLRHRSLPVFSIQYHPEASPGPNDSAGYFDQFLRLIDEQS
jgi:carbamoyl-phosphate synthase small subunit